MQVNWESVSYSPTGGHGPLLRAPGAQEEQSACLDHREAHPLFPGKVVTYRHTSADQLNGSHLRHDGPTGLGGDTGKVWDRAQGQPQ